MKISYEELKTYIKNLVLSKKQEIEEDMYIASLKWDKDLNITEEILPQKIMIKGNLFSLFGYYYKDNVLTKRRTNLKNKNIFKTKQDAEAYLQTKFEEFKKQINNKIFLLKENVNSLERRVKND